MDAPISKGNKFLPLFTWKCANPEKRYITHERSLRAFSAAQVLCETEGKKSKVVIQKSKKIIHKTKEETVREIKFINFWEKNSLSAAKRMK